MGRSTRYTSSIRCARPRRSSVCRPEGAYMLMHDVRLALRSLKRNPILSTFMIGAIAVGIAASMIAITLYHVRSGHSIPWKADTLYAVTMDLRDDDPDIYSDHPEY